jgi:hypothetical protein
MTGPAMKAGWLYLSEGEIERAERLIASLKEDDAADSMGLRRLNDLISEWLYPGLTTPMTRARYFVFIPTLMRKLEKGRHRTPELAGHAAKEAQHELRKAIGNVDGNIGRKSGERLKKWSTTIYWNGLKSLGIFTQPLSEGAYYRAISRAERSEWRSDDGIMHGDEQTFWDADCPSVRELGSRAPHRRIVFAMTKKEAQYLQTRFFGLKGADLSLLGYRLTRRDRVAAKYPWDVSAPGRLSQVLRHAQAFSATARGLSLAYYHLVHKARKHEKAAADVAREFTQWRAAAERLVKDWDLGEFDAIMEEGAYQTRSVDLPFLKAFQSALTDPSSSRGISDALSKLVRDRELRRKKTKCRLCGNRAHARYLRQWKRPEDEDPVYSFVYRHKVGQQVLTEILQGLDGHVQA